MEKVIDIIIDHSIHRPIAIEKCINEILPRKISGNTYTFKEIDVNLFRLSNELKKLNSENNDYFDQVLDDETKDKLKDLYENLHNLQLEMMKLQCEIAFAKEQQNTVVNKCDNRRVQKYREIITKEKEIRIKRKQLRFQTIVEFFGLFTNYLIQCETDFRNYLTIHRTTVNYKQQMFDWSKYHQLLSLIRASGKSIIDADRIERLYQHDTDIKEISFRQDLNELNFNSFVEFYETCNLELTVDLSVDRFIYHISLKEYLKLPDIVQVVDCGQSVKYDILNEQLKKLTIVNDNLCQLLIDINMDYIEAHLTDGINIDKLNGGENSTLSPLEEQQTLPQYAFSPQEYITQIGQHILTLRKQTEPYDVVENGFMKFGLDSGILNLQCLSKLPINSSWCIKDVVLRSIARLCVQSLLGRTSQSILKKLTPNGRRQLSTDVLYLDNVLEDLKLLDPNDPNFSKFKSLLTQ